MKLSVSVELVWQLAAREAMAGEFREIEPEHVFAAVLKFSEMPPQLMGNLGVDADVAALLTSDVQAVRQEILSHSIDSTSVRRQLRTLLGKGGNPYTGGALHRSQSSRNVFSTAATLAEESHSETLAAVHLLKALLASPTSAMNQVLSPSSSPATQSPKSLPRIDAHGRDLSKLATEGRIDSGTRRQAECKAILQSLQQANRKSILLITNHDEAAHAVVCSVASAMAGKESRKPLAGRRIIDVTSVPELLGADPGSQQVAVELLSEAASAPEVLLYLPAIGTTCSNTPRQSYESFLKSHLRNGAVQCIVRTTPDVYEKLAKSDKTWKSMVDVFHIRETPDDSLPQEL